MPVPKTTMGIQQAPPCLRKDTRASKKHNPRLKHDPGHQKTFTPSPERSPEGYELKHSLVQTDKHSQEVCLLEQIANRRVFRQEEQLYSVGYEMHAFVVLHCHCHDACTQHQIYAMPTNAAQGVCRLGDTRCHVRHTCIYQTTHNKKYRLHVKQNHAQFAYLRGTVPQSPSRQVCHVRRNIVQSFLDKHHTTANYATARHDAYAIGSRIPSLFQVARPISKQHCFPYIC